MSMPPRSARSAPRAERVPSLPAPWPAVLATLLPVLAALWIHRDALGAYFTTDDLILFERARGLAPWPDTVWRLISGRLYWQALFPVFGVDPLGWHVLGLLLHGVATALAAATARRLGASNTVAFLAALVFGVSARVRTLVQQVSGTGEILAVVLTLAALILLTRRRALAATPVHAAALLCKETVALAPLAAVVAGPAGERTARLRAALPALVLSAALWAYVLTHRAATGSLGGEAYAFGFGANLFRNLVTHVMWSADPLHLGAAVAQPAPMPWALASLAVLAALVTYAWRSNDAVARAGLVLWFALVLPVLPLRNAVYEHYVYGARFGLALAFAQALVALLSRGLAPAPAARRVLAVVAALAVMQAGSAELAMGVMRGARGAAAGLPRDSFVRKMEVIRNVARTLGPALGAEPVRLVLYVPPASMRLVSSRTGLEVPGAASMARYTLLPAVLDDGRGLRALFPQITDVRFADGVERADTNALVATHSQTGEVLVAGTGPVAHARLAALWTVNHFEADARQHLTGARALYPGSALLAFAAAHAAPPESVEARLREAHAEFPDSLDTLQPPGR